MRRIELVFIVFVLPSIIRGDCNIRTSCDQCMAETDCVWCPDPSIKSKCMDISEANVKCSVEVINVGNLVDILEDRPLRPDSEDNQFVQIRPQKIAAKIRPGKPVKIDFQVSHAKEFPIDLYFLMDLSWSMRKSRENLANLGGEIINAIKKKTKNLATGFGSFVEKNVAPFTSAIPSFNCNQEKESNCTPPYSFYHKSVLDDISAKRFYNAVMESPMAGNVDDPEGSLDALMQVIEIRSILNQ